VCLIFRYSVCVFLMKILLRYQVHYYACSVCMRVIVQVCLVQFLKCFCTKLFFLFYLHEKLSHLLWMKTVPFLVLWLFLTQWLWQNSYISCSNKDLDTTWHLFRNALQNSVGRGKLLTLHMNTNSLHWCLCLTFKSDFGPVLLK